MKQSLKALLAALLTLASCAAGGALPLGPPPVRQFTPDLDVYPQNFSIAVDDRSRVFVGNTEGVLIFDGAYWQLVPVSNGDIVRSLARGPDERIYVGGYDGFGYIEQIDTGAFVYRELSRLFEAELDGDRFADIWRIQATEDAIWFVGLEHLFRYEPRTGATELAVHEGSFGAITEFQGRVLLQFRGEGIKEYVDGAWRLLEGPDFSRVFLSAMTPLSADELVIVATDTVWHRYDGARFTPIPASLDVPLRESATTAIAVDTHRIALPTSLGKIVLHDLDTQTSEVVDASLGFISDAVRSGTGQLLLADDQGIRALSWPAPWRIVDGALAGSVHRFVVHGGDSYALTSSGAFVFRDGASTSERLPWTDHEAWDLLPLDDGSFLFADSYELSLIAADGTRTILDPSTTARVFLRSARDPDRVYVGSEYGLRILQRDGGTWRTVLENEEMDNLRITHLVETADDELWIGSERGGIRRLNFTTGATWTLTQHRLDVADGLEYGREGLGAYLYEIDGRLVASTASGRFAWDGAAFARVADDGLDALLPQGQTAHLGASAGERWAFTHSHLFRDAGGWTELDVSVLAPGALETIDFEEDRVILGTLGALLLFDPGQAVTLRRQPSLFLSSARVQRPSPDPDQPRPSLRLPLDRVAVSSADERLTLRYVLPDLSNPHRVRYRSRLKPAEADFSPWTEASEQTFVALAPGSYRFEVEARTGDAQVTRLEVPIEVVPQWFEMPAIRGAALATTMLVLLFLATRIGRRRARILAGERDRLEVMVEERTRALRHANKQLDDLAHLDGLTQIPNRRRLDGYLEDVWHQCLARRRHVALALIDVDHFKRYNDSFGHQAGDDLLVALAALLSGHLRRTEDLVARYGGEEFLLVLPGADEGTALQIVEEMRAATEDSDLGVTISAGVSATLPDAEESLTTMIAAADTALYEAKRAGRNRVELARHATP
ncbi:MAG TPA: GGDEF domain-containing protein [Pseudomonadales bacterium]|nr:GGDEF domain-containing protein [Pseudomonadales bacterium]